MNTTPTLPDSEALDASDMGTTPPAWIGELIARLEAGPAELLRREAAARFCGMSPRSWDTMTAKAENPPLTEVGPVRGWLRSDLLLWLGSGCPGRDEFLRLKRRANR